MKKLILLAILFSGCDKPEKETFVPPKKDIKVVEYVTNLPVAGANLDLYEYRLFNYNYLYRGLTDNNGESGWKILQVVNIVCCSEFCIENRNGSGLCWGATHQG